MGGVYYDPKVLFFLRFLESASCGVPIFGFSVHIVCGASVLLELEDAAFFGMKLLLSCFRSVCQCVEVIL